jgi:hypothetical protein
MDDFADVDPETLVAGHADWLGSDQFAALAAHPLDCVDTEYPHHVGGALEGPGDVEAPAEQHPVFYGCYDWHSSVHSHWALVRGLRLADDHPDEDAVVDSVAARLTAENVADEVAYLEEHESFERPYGWAWLLRLVAELALWDDARADEWRATLQPLEETVAELVARTFLPVERPIRVGTHGNTAFALAALLDYARVVGDDELADAAAAAARACYGDDEDYPLGYEPLGWDFLSPGLAEADLLGRVLDADAFAGWLDGFLPGLSGSPETTLPEPVAPDGDGGMALHLVGLDLSRAWCMAGVADALGDHPAVGALRRSAGAHAEAGMARAFTDDYAGAHWLSSFVLYLLTRNDGGIAPAADGP